MIRPVTCICALLAGGAGLFLYQAKHRTLMLDRQIEQTFHDLEDARSKIGIMQAEWALLNSPDRLAELADKFLALKPVAPTQFVTLADLDQRLPPPQPLVAEAGATDTPAEPAAAAAPTEAAADPPTAEAPPRSAAPPAPDNRSGATAAAPGPVRHELRHGRAEPRREAAGDSHSPRRNQDLRGEPPERHRPAAVAERERPTANRVKPAASRPATTYAAAAADVPRARPARVETAARLDRPAPVYAAAPPPARPEIIFARAPVTGSLLGGVHTVMAPPVPVADVR